MAKVENRIRQGVIWGILLAAVLAANVSAKLAGSIVLKTGEAYDSVTFSVNNVYKTITIELDDRDREVSFKDISRITDQSGNDITRDILGSRYSPAVRETWVSENSEVYRHATAKLWNCAVRFSGNYSIPIGDYYEGIESNIGFEADLRIALSYQADVRFMVSRAGMKLDDDFRIYSLDPDISIIDQKWGFHVMRYIIALEMYKPLDKYKKDLNYFYLYSGLGAAVHTMSGDITLLNNNTMEIASASDSYTEKKFAMTVGLGLIAALAPNFGFDFSASYDFIVAGNASNESGNGVVYAYILDLKIGAVYFF